MEYEVSRTTGKCAITDRELAEGDAYYAVLLETPEGFARCDYATDAWTGPPEGCFCYWRGRVPVREKKRGPIVVDQELLLHFFQRLEEANSEVQQQFRFVLALLLLRKRLLKLEDTFHQEEQEYWRLRLVRDQSEHLVLNPRLSNEQVDRLNSQMQAILGGDAEVIESLDMSAEGQGETSIEAG